jgi:hypothetical protein
MSFKNGITEGKSHAEGGIPMVVKSTGQSIEMEGGEGVINKKNMASTKKYNFQGKDMTICEVASMINSENGNGVKIDCDGIVGKKYKFNLGGGVEDNEIHFHDYKGEQIMYEPHYNKYYTNDEEFDTLEEAKNYIDGGSPIDEKTIDAYRKGAFEKGGWVLFDADTEEIIKEYKTRSEARQMMYEYDGNGIVVQKAIAEKIEAENDFVPKPKTPATYIGMKKGGKINIDPIPSLKELGGYLKEHETHKIKRRRRFDFGGSTDYVQPHPIHLVLDVNYEAPTYNSAGQYLYNTKFKEDKIYKLMFLNSNGGYTAFEIPKKLEYVYIPNKLVTIRGFEQKYSDGGLTPYNHYNDILSDNDKKVLEFMRIIDLDTITLKQKEMLSSFRGTNVANHLYTDLIEKIYGLLFKDKPSDKKIENILIKNNGVGNILALTPTYIKKTYIEFDENHFSQIEKEINSITNNEKQGWDWYSNNNDSTLIDSIIYVYPTINPKEEILQNEHNNNKSIFVSIGVAEFSSIDDLKYFTYIIKMRTDLTKYKYNILEINKGLSSEGKFTLIYTFKNSMWYWKTNI